VRPYIYRGKIMYSTGLAYLLWLFSGCGALGFHRFYLGKIPSGILWMFTGGLLGLGSFYDLLTLPRQVRLANLEKRMLEENSLGRWRDTPNGRTQLISNSPNNEKESNEQIILKIAKANKGILTASELALSAKISIEEAKKVLDMMVSKGYAELRVRQSGSLVYAIPDLMDQHEPLVD